MASPHIEIGSLDERDACAALEAYEWRRKGEALFEAKRILEECGATDARRIAFPENLASVRRRLDEADRAHQNALEFSRKLEALNRG